MSKTDLQAKQARDKLRHERATVKDQWGYTWDERRAKEKLRHERATVRDQWGYTWDERHELECMYPGAITNDLRVKGERATRVKRAKFVGKSADGLEWVYHVTLKDGTKTQVFYHIDRTKPYNPFICRRVDFGT
jgi:hypothetical protein